MTGIEKSEGTFAGPVIEARNWSADQEGSIHDDATASKLGFRGGTVAGSIHMDQFAPVLVAMFGNDWLRRGYLSLYFQNATTDGEPVRAYAARSETQERETAEGPVEIWMQRTDGLEVMRGNAGLGAPADSALRTRDLRATSAGGLRIVGDAAELALGPFDVHLGSNKQTGRIKNGLVSDPLSCFSDPSEYGGVVASPASLVELLWYSPTQALRKHVRSAVGLFGAIEVAHVLGPVLLDRDYEVRADVIAVGESPKTEFLWFDSVARADDGESVATMRMLLRFMKASSKVY